MTKQAQKKRRRGRPKSPTEGARQAYEFVEAFRKQHSLSLNAMALMFGMTPSTVSRSLRNPPSRSRMTPGLQQLYSTALNWQEGMGEDGQDRRRRGRARSSPALQLADYSGPGEATVRRILQDIAELVGTLGASG